MAAATRLLAIVLAMLLALTMLPAADIQAAFADEPVARPAAVGGDVALSGFEGNDASASAGTPIATQREDGALVADGLVYAATDDGLALVGFDGGASAENTGASGTLGINLVVPSPEGADDGAEARTDFAVPAAVSVDGKDTPVVAIAIAEGNVAENIVALTLPQSIESVDTATLAAALPNLASVEVAAPKASAPVAAGAAALRAAYSSFGGVLYKNAWVATDGDASQTTLTKELVWAPPATVVARIPAECTSIAPGAFADANDLKTVVCFGVMRDIAQTQKAEDGTVIPGAFTDEQIATANVIVPQTGTVVPNGDHVSASVAVTDHSTMDVKREAWWKSGFASDRITLGEVYGSTTNTLPVTEEGVLETAEAEVAYAPETTQNSSSRKAGIKPPESAIPTPVPDDDQADPSESGLVFTHLADMTLSVSWKGDPTATPTHLDIPAYATINGVTYPVTEIAPNAFEGAVFLESVNIPEGVAAVGKDAFKGCTNLSEAKAPSTAKGTADAASIETSAPLASLEEIGTNHPTPSQILSQDVEGIDASDAQSSTISSLSDGKADTISSYASKTFTIRVSKQDYVSGLTIDSDSGMNATLDNSQVDEWRITFSSDSFAYVGFLFRDIGSLWLSAHGNKLTLFGCNASSYISSINMVLNFAVRPGYKLMGFEFYGDQINSATTGYSSTVMFENTYAISVRPVVVRDVDSALTPYAKTADIQSWVNENFLTKAATDLDNFYNKAAFNTISYAGLEDASYAGALPTFYVNDASKLPTVPEPKRDGYKFTGWTWGDSSSPNKDASGAFSAGGPVTLTAKWEESPLKSSYFFSEDDPYNSGSSADQPDVIAVKLSSDEGKRLASIKFEDDSAGLVANAGSIEFKVDNDKGMASANCRTVTGWGSATASMPLVPLEGGGYGVYIKVTVRGGAVDASKVVESYADGSYVASFVKLDYTLSDVSA